MKGWWWVEVDDGRKQTKPNAGRDEEGARAITFTSRLIQPIRPISIQHTPSVQKKKCQITLLRTNERFDLLGTEISRRRAKNTAAPTTPDANHFRDAECKSLRRAARLENFRMPTCCPDPNAGLEYYASPALPLGLLHRRWL